jgi:recombination protein RecT
MTEQHEQTKALVAYLGARQPQIQNAMSEMARRYMTPEKLVKLFLVALSRQPKLLQCTQDSILLALTRAGECALDPSGKGGQGHLVPFKNTRRGGALEAQFIPGYQGMILNLRRDGIASHVEADVVYADDFFEYERGLEPKLRHVPKTLGYEDPTEEWKKIQYAYAIARTGEDGVSTPFEVVPKNYLARIRKTAKAKDSEAPWQKWPAAMAKKTAIKQLAKLLPIDTDSLAMQTIEADNEVGVAEQVIDIEGVAVEAEAAQSATEALKKELAAKNGEETTPSEPDRSPIRDDEVPQETGTTNGKDEPQMNAEHADQGNGKGE